MTKRKRNQGFRGLADVQSCVRKEMGSRPEAMCDFIDALEQEAYEIADHAASNWQDAALARHWISVARDMGKVGERCRKKWKKFY